MTNVRILVGNGTHTGNMLGYCPSCGLYHASAAANAACRRLLEAAAETAAEALAWGALKIAVALEQSALVPSAMLK